MLRRTRDRVDALTTRALWNVVFWPVAAAYALTVRTDRRQMSPDPVAVVPSAWSLAHHGTPSVLRTLWTTTAGWAVPFDPTHVVTSRTPGLVLLAAPLYRIWPGAGPADQLPASLLAAVITAAAVASLAVLFSKLASRRVALVAALIAAFATTTWTVSGSALWPHGPDQLFLIIAMSGLAAGTAARAGLGFALCMLVRPPLAIVAAVAGLAFSWARRSLRPAITIGLISGLGLLAFVAYADHYWHSGQAGGGALSGATVHGYHGSFFDVSPAAMLDLAEKIGSALVAPNHGILPYSPFLLVLAFGLPAAWRNAPGWVRSSAVGGVLYFVIQMKSEVFDGGTNFWGYRYPLETLTLMAPLLLLAWTHWVSRGLRRRAAFAALVVASVGMQVIGALSFQLPLTTHVWAPADLVTAVVGSPGTITVALAGGIGACVTYLAMTRRTAHQPATV